MRLLTRLVSMTAVATLTAVGLLAAPASAATISSGHIDAFDLDYANGALTLDIKTYAPDNPANDDLSPASTVLAVSTSSTVTIPSSSPWNCLGPGSTYYVAPQGPVAGVIWPGWNAQEVPAAQGPVTLEYVPASSTLPAGARFALYAVTAGTPSIKLNTNSAAGCTVSTWPGGIAAGAHAHGNWVFSHTGTYTLTFKATAAGGATSGNVTYTFQI